MEKKVLIIEDEKPAQIYLAGLILDMEPDFKVLAILDSVQSSVDWLKNNTADLIFMDIHLIDGVSFSIFDQVVVQTPVIFTTAYDSYAIKAFKVNSIDYLLKPIDAEDLRLSLDKFIMLNSNEYKFDIDTLLRSLQQPIISYQQRFIVQRGERLMSVTTDQIAYFEGEDRYVYLIKKDGAKFIINYRLSDLENILDPKLFFRLNRSFITHFESIQSMVNVSKSRIKVELYPKAKREIIISSENSQDFKKWLNN